MKSIKLSNYDIDFIFKEVKKSLDGEDDFKEYINVKDFNQIVRETSMDKDNRIMELILDSIIDSRKKQIDDLELDLENDITRSNEKQGSMDIENYLRSIGIDTYNVNAEKIIDDYKYWSKENKDITKSMYVKYFEQYIDLNRLSEVEIKNGIVNLINKLEDKNNYSAAIRNNCPKFIERQGLAKYLNSVDIQNAYINPIKYGYADTNSAMRMLYEEAINNRLTDSISKLKLMSLSRKERIIQLKIILRYNRLNSTMSDNELLDMYY